MRWQLVAPVLAAVGATARTERFAGIHNKARNTAAEPPPAPRGVPFDKWTRDGPVEKKFFNSNTTSECDQRAGGYSDTNNHR